MDPETLVTRPASEVTRLLGKLGSEEDPAIFDRLLSLVYAELRKLADGYLRRERPDHTLQATALVHEAFLKLSGQCTVDWQSKQHFLAIAATSMRRILVDHAREKHTLRRGGDRDRVNLDSDLVATQSDDTDLVALDEALDELAALDERKVKVVEMRFFVGMTLEETAAALGISDATVKREWRTARAWLRRELDRGA